MIFSPWTIVMRQERNEIRGTGVVYKDSLLSVHVGTSFDSLW